MVWLVLYRDTKDGVAKTSQADIARRAGISVRTAQAGSRPIATATGCCRLSAAGD